MVKYTHTVFYNWYRGPGGHSPCGLINHGRRDLQSIIFIQEALQMYYKQNHHVLYYKEVPVNQVST